MSPLISMIAGAAASAWKTVAGALTAFSDNFNRTTSGSLGTSSSGNLWSALRGVWFADGAAAKTNDTASTYPIANIEMSSASVTASATTGSWIQISANGTVGSISSNSADSTTYFTATITGMSSTTGMAIGQRIRATNGTGSLFGGTPDYVEITNVVSSTSITYRTRGGTTPTAGSITAIETANNDGGSGIALWITDSGNWWGVSYGRSINNSCNCQSCNTSFCNTFQNYSSQFCSGFTNYASSFCSGFTNYASSFCSGFTNYASSFCSGWTNSPSTFCSAFGFSSSTFCSAFGNSQSSFCGGWTITGPTYTCNGWSSNTSFSCQGWNISSYACDFFQKTGFGFNIGSWTCVEWGPRYSCNSFQQSTTFSCSSSSGPTWTATCTGGTFTAWNTTCTGGSFTAWNTTCTGGTFTAWNSVCSGGTFTSWSPACSGGTFTSWSPACSGGTFTSWSPACSGGTFTSWSPACSGGTFTSWSPSCVSTTWGWVSCNCQTCYPPYIRIFKSVSNSISEVTRWSLSAMASAFRVITNSATKTITIRPFRDVSMSTQIGSDLTRTESTATMETKFGIVLSPSDNIQGATLDDYNITSN